MMHQIDTTAVTSYLCELQDRICDALTALDGTACFTEESWSRDEGGGGRSRVMAGGRIFEKAGVGL